MPFRFVAASASAEPTARTTVSAYTQREREMESGNRVERDSHAAEDGAGSAEYGAAAGSSVDYNHRALLPLEELMRRGSTAGDMRRLVEGEDPMTPVFVSLNLLF